MPLNPIFPQLDELRQNDAQKTTPDVFSYYNKKGKYFCFHIQISLSF